MSAAARALAWARGYIDRADGEVPGTYSVVVACAAIDPNVARANTVETTTPVLATAC